MPTPTPAQLRAYAARLRELAAAQRRRADTVESLLGPVVALDDPDTWSGAYPDATHLTFQNWVAQLRSTAAALRADATSWSGLADDYDHQASQVPAGNG